MKKNIFNLFVILCFMACNNHTHDRTDSNSKMIGTVERLDPSLDALMDSAAKAEIIAEGFEWSEGPVWVAGDSMLLFSDVPTNTIYSWTEKNGKQVYLYPSGYTDSAKRGGEMGSNGLLLDDEGNLVLCQHGDRRMAMMNAATASPEFTTIVDRYQGKKFNSPNDAAFDMDGNLFFTDPPYGLEKGTDDPKKEIGFQGVYRINRDGLITLVVDSITRPNGIGILEDGKRILVANSDPGKPNWYAIDLDSSGKATAVRIFYSAANTGNVKGLPDGFKIDSKGNVFATGPGGIWVFNKQAKLLGKFRLDESTSNVALSPDEKTLYITNDMYVLRVKMKS